MTSVLFLKKTKHDGVLSLEKPTRKQRIIGYGFVALFIISFIIGFSGESNFSLGDKLFRSIGLKVWTNDTESIGLHLPGFVAIGLIIFSWIGIVWYVRRFHPNIRKKLPLLFIVMFFVGGPILHNVTKDIYFKWQDGVEAIEYFPQNSWCDIQRSSERHQIAVVECELTFKNHSKSEQQFQIIWNNFKWFNNNQLELQNHDNNSTFTIKGKKDKKFYVSFEMNSEYLVIQSGSANGPTITLKST